MEKQPVEEGILENKLQYFPVSFFASVMGISGLAVAFERYEQVFKLSGRIGLILLIAAYLACILVAITYSFKIIKHFSAVVSEFNHPVKANFFPAFSISLLLLSTGTINYQEKLAFGLWVIGAAAHFILTIVIISRWITRKYQILQVNPTWFIPVVGNIIIPIAGIKFVNIEICWFFFSIGLFFWVILFALIFYRVVLHDPMPKQLFPTLFIFIAPPSVAFIAYTKIVGHMDSFSRILLYIAWFFVLLLLSMAGYFIKLDFAVTWWAYTFPLSAVTIASIAAFDMLNYPLFGWVASGLLVLTSLVIVVVILKTISAILHNEVFVPE
ncbi:Tellurite resistance protein tehA [Dehalobacter sp. UNSWDHB]|uniref:SLAC1 anion channel family protein n=1 Tax=Dehalobacter sp. UNSWDHB TaxID=1339256 RepID=UPI0003876045|nr:SLAC1 anion channel family protein [Dehalobacter sp. UNSWDHB]EQB21998.1 Tellurite resistance protein tehA [Dehalobacter sp. UNSWDHB]